MTLYGSPFTVLQHPVAFGTSTDNQDQSTIELLHEDRLLLEGCFATMYDPQSPAVSALRRG